MVALVLDGLVGFPAGLSPTSFHLSPSSFHLSPRLGARGRVPGWLVSHFLPLLFNCLPVLFTCLPGWVLVVGFPAGLSPTSFHLSPSSFHLSPRPLPFICLPLLFIVSGWVLVVGFPAGLSPTSFHLSPTSFHLSPRLGGRVPGRLVSHFLSFVSHFFSACGRVPGRVVSHFLLFVSHFFSFFSQAGCLWSGSRLACLPLPCISPISFYLSPASFHLSPRLGACSPVSGRLVSHFLAFVSHFFPKQFTVRGSQFFLKTCPPFVSLLVSAHFHWPCNISIHPSPRSVTVGVRPFPLAMQHFYSCVSQVCHWWCPPISAGRVAFLFICLPGLSLLAMQHFYSFVSQVCHLRCPPFSAGDATFLFICFPGLSLLMSALFCWPCSFICLPGLSLSITGGVRPFLLAM